jgi:hypothetical protein
MVMELCARGDLRSLLVAHRAEKWPASEVLVRWTSEVAEGVAFVHSKGVVHRDLRAQNVLVQAVDVEGKQLVAKVGDFGLALAADTTQRGGATLLPLRWCAPEAMVSGGRFSEASDSWSFGVVIWEMFTQPTSDRTHMWPLTRRYGSGCSAASDWPSGPAGLVYRRRCGRSRASAGSGSRRRGRRWRRRRNDCVHLCLPWFVPARRRLCRLPLRWQRLPLRRRRRCTVQRGGDVVGGRHGAAR